MYETNYQLSINDIARRKNDFLVHPSSNPNFGFQNSAVWILSSVTNVSNTSDWVFTINFSQLDKVDFYLIQNGKLLAQSRQGKVQLEQQFRVPTLRAKIDSASPVDLYIRVESQSSSIIVPLRAQAAEHHNRYFQLDSLLWGVFYGGLLILAIYNLVLYIGAVSYTHLTLPTSDLV